MNRLSMSLSLSSSLALLLKLILFQTSYPTLSRTQKFKIRQGIVLRRTFLLLQTKPRLWNSLVKSFLLRVWTWSRTTTWRMWFMRRCAWRPQFLSVLVTRSLRIQRLRGLSSKPTNQCSLTLTACIIWRISGGRIMTSSNQKDLRSEENIIPWVSCHFWQARGSVWEKLSQKILSKLSCLLYWRLFLKWNLSIRASTWISLKII